MKTRKIQRKTITIPGRYFTGRGSPKDVIIADLSPGGCRFTVSEQGLIPGTRLQIFIGNTGPFHAVVKWAAKGEVGLTFATPIDEEQFERFKNSHVPDFTNGEATGSFEEVPDALPNRFC